MTVNRYIQTPIMHRVIEAGGLYFIGGTTADDKTAGIEGQTEQILTKLDGFLSQVGSNMDCVVQATIYMSDLSLKSRLNEVWGKFFQPDHLPARVAVGAVLAKGTLVEMTFVVAKP